MENAIYLCDAHSQLVCQTGFLLYSQVPNHTLSLYMLYSFGVFFGLDIFLQLSINCHYTKVNQSDCPIAGPNYLFLDQVLFQMIPHNHLFCTDLAVLDGIPSNLQIEVGHQ